VARRRSRAGDVDLETDLDERLVHHDEFLGPHARVRRRLGQDVSGD
jgi:hypothetical protein